MGRGKTYSVRDFVKASFKHFNLNYENYVTIDSKYFRPSEVKILLSDSNKAKMLLNWEPKISLTELIDIMCESDYNLVLKENL